VARYALPGGNVFPEGITEGGGIVFYVGSMGDGTIYRGDTVGALGGLCKRSPATGRRPARYARHLPGLT
jgi:hypothetical protein